MNTIPTLLISRSQVAALLALDEAILAVEQAFRLYGEGKVMAPSILGVHAEHGGFHIKAGIMNLGKNYFVAKTNANYPGNKKFNLPTIQGVVMVSDADNGRLLALLDSIEITIIRTGAATAVAAKYLSRQDAKTATIVGCGNQGRISLKMLQQVRPLERFWVYDSDPTVAANLSVELNMELQVEILQASDLGDAIRQSEIVVTCTSSKQPFLKREWLQPGTFVAAVGADNEDKQELDVTVLSDSKLITDLTAQCASIGELHHGIEAGVITKDHVFAELGEVVARKKPGRSTPDEIIVFDSTGMALQDVVSSAIVYEKALENSKGLRFNFQE